MREAVAQGALGVWSVQGASVRRDHAWRKGEGVRRAAHGRGLGVCKVIEQIPAKFAGARG